MEPCLPPETLTVFVRLEDSAASAPVKIRVNKDDLVEDLVDFLLWLLKLPSKAAATLYVKGAKEPMEMRRTFFFFFHEEAATEGLEVLLAYSV